MTEAKIFSFQNATKVAEVELDVLSQSAQLKNAGTNNPGPTRPIQSWELIVAIQEMLAKNNIEYKQDPIWVEKRSSKRILTKDEENEYDEDNTPASKWHFDHLVTKINMPVVKGLNPSIGISFNKKGIQVVWGTNVVVCENMCVFGDNVISTYGASKTPFGKQMQLLEFWSSKMDELFAQDAIIIEGMQKKKLKEPKILETIGLLYQRAIQKAYNLERGVVSPLNTGAMSTMVQNMLKAESQIATVWDLYNAGTEIIKPGHFNLEDIIPTNKAWGEFLIEEFSIV